MKGKTGIGLDSHQFVKGESDRVFVLGGLVFDDAPALSGNSDADVILHAVTDAISGVTGQSVIGAVADAMCKEGITDSKEYLKVALAGRLAVNVSAKSGAAEHPRTMIFDEVDAGVGGAVAEAVGGRLKQLADSAQVLVVTHSPQVAACGDHQWRISKQQQDGTNQTQVEELPRQAREEEIARMLAGATVTDEARAAAAKLLGAI